MDLESLAGRDAIRERELLRVMVWLRRIRGGVLLLASAVVVRFGLFGPSEVRTGPVLAVLAVYTSVLAFDAWRLLARRRPSRAAVPYDLALAVLAQTGIIVLTGGGEGPFVPVYVVLALGSGVILGRALGARLLMVGMLLAFLLLACAPSGFFPDILGYAARLEPADRWARLLVLMLMSLGLHRVGLTVRDTIDRMLDTAIRAREQALSTLAERSAEQVELSASIAHELKNPLASVQGLVQLLEKGDQNAARRFEVLKGEISRMRGILDEFLEYSRPLGELQLAPFDARRLCDELTLLHEPLIQSRGLAVHAPEETPQVMGDEKKLKQALINLLQNALDATPKGGRIEWIARRREGRVELGLRDGGPGFPPQLLEQGVRFGASGKQGGHGIGLPVAKSIAEQHGGRLVLRSLIGGGAEAFLELPAEPTRAPS